MAIAGLAGTKRIEQLANEGRAAFYMMMKSDNVEEMYYWNKVWLDINQKIRDGEYIQ